MPRRSANVALQRFQRFRRPMRPELRFEIAALDYVFPALLQICDFGADGGTLGRDERNTLVLPDRYSRVSRMHAEVTFVRGVPILSNRSRTLVINVSDQEIAPGDSSIVQDDDVIEIGPYLLTARVSYATSSVLPAPAASAQAANPISNQSLTAAFAAGAKLPPGLLEGGLTVDIAELIGGMLRHAVAGTMDLMAARAITQREIRLSAPELSSERNNPLLFLPGAESALVQLLTGQLPGFMHATRVMPDAFADLLGHEAGIKAGTHAAFADIMLRLDPRQADSVLVGTCRAEDQVAASSDKARWWDNQSQRYARVLSQAEDNHQALWGNAFVDAYEGTNEQVRQQVVDNLRAIASHPVQPDSASSCFAITSATATATVTQTEACLTS